MIDKKVLEKLARLDDATILRRLPDNERSFFEYGFQRGYNRALKDLWHPASEDPDKHRICLVRVVYHLNHGMLHDEERIEQSSFHDFGWYDYDFKYIGVDYDIVSYLYVDELLPKKGGNHD